MKAQKEEKDATLTEYCKALPRTTYAFCGDLKKNYAGYLMDSKCPLKKGKKA